MLSIIKKFRKIAGIDLAVGLSFAARVWTGSAGILTILFSAKFLSFENQGVYYSFLSLIAFQSIAELGLTFSITQFCSHEMANLTWGSDDLICGDNKYKNRLRSVLLFSLVWFSSAAVLLIFILVPFGLWFFDSAISKKGLMVDYEMPWVLLVVFSAGNLFVSALTAFIEGCGKINQVITLRLSQSVVSLPIGWLLLCFGGDLYAMPVAALVTFTVGFGWLFSRYFKMFKNLINTPKDSSGIQWRKEMFPFQWKMGLSWISGYLVFNIVNPIMLANQGPIVTGQLGMSLQIFSGINSVALVWIMPKVPIYGYLVAIGDRDKLDRMFDDGLKRSTLFIIIAITAFMAIISVANRLEVPLSKKVLDLHFLIPLGVASIAFHITHAQALYLRSHKREPFLIMSLLSGIVTVLGNMFAVPRYGVTGAVYVYVFVIVAIGLCYGSYIFKQHRVEWGRESV